MGHNFDRYTEVRNILRQTEDSSGIHSNEDGEIAELITQSARPFGATKVPLSVPGEKR